MSGETDRKFRVREGDTLSTTDNQFFSGSIKGLFPEFFLDDTERNKQIWEYSTIVLDANVLLNLYELTTESVKQYLEAMDVCKKRIWLPNWVVYEFLVLRERIIEDQVSSYDTLKNEISKAIRSLDAQDKHPYVDTEELADIKSKIHVTFAPVSTINSPPPVSLAFPASWGRPSCSRIPGRIPWGPRIQRLRKWSAGLRQRE